LLAYIKGLSGQSYSGSKLRDVRDALNSHSARQQDTRNTQLHIAQLYFYYFDILPWSTSRRSLQFHVVYLSHFQNTKQFLKRTFLDPPSEWTAMPWDVYSLLAPLMRLASCISFGMIVTRLPWIAHRFASSKRLQRCASAASCKAKIAVPCQRKAIRDICCWISRTNRANGNLRSSKSVDAWYALISRNARSPEKSWRVMVSCPWRMNTKTT